VKSIVSTVLTAALIALAPGIAAAQSIEGPTWLAEDIANKGVVDRVQTTLKIENGRVAGRGGCNRYTGAATIQGASLTFGAVAATRMACPPAVMEQETRFFRMLEQVRGFAFDRTLLLLKDAAGQTLARFSAL
jgi:putative lipoprotein